MYRSNLICSDVAIIHITVQKKAFLSYRWFVELCQSQSGYNIGVWDRRTCIIYFFLYKQTNYQNGFYDLLAICKKIWCVYFFKRDVAFFLYTMWRHIIFLLLRRQITFIIIFIYFNKALEDSVQTLSSINALSSK